MIFFTMNHNMTQIFFYPFITFLIPFGSRLLSQSGLVIWVWQTWCLWHFLLLSCFYSYISIAPRAIRSTVLCTPSNFLISSAEQFTTPFPICLRFSVHRRVKSRYRHLESSHSIYPFFSWRGGWIFGHPFKIWSIDPSEAFCKVWYYWPTCNYLFKNFR